MRDQVATPYEILLVLGGISAALFAVVVVGVWHRRRWAPPLLLALALVDIVGEFFAQGTVMVEIMVSFIVACALLVLAWRARRRYEASVAVAAPS
jgi:predicted branched-subunit amino acid permease